jgi:hypothetical protein
MNLRAITALLFEVSGQDALERSLDAFEYYGLVHTVEGGARVRVVLPLVRDADLKEHAGLVAWAVSMTEGAGLTLSRESFEPAHFWPEPGPTPGEPYEARMLPGRVKLDPGVAGEHELHKEPPERPRARAR